MDRGWQEAVCQGKLNKIYSFHQVNMVLKWKQDKNPARKRIALVVHDNKNDRFEWPEFNCLSLINYDLYGTGTTRLLLQNEFDLMFTLFQSGLLGCDQQLRAKISSG